MEEKEKKALKTIGSVILLVTGGLAIAVLMNKAQAGTVDILSICIVALLISEVILEITIEASVRRLLWQVILTIPIVIILAMAAL